MDAIPSTKGPRQHKSGIVSFELFNITMQFLVVALGALGLVSAAPASSVDAVTVTTVVDSASTGYDWSANWLQTFPIHNSCNETNYNQLVAGLAEAQELAAHARDHTVRFGNNSNFFRKYFGDDTPSGEVVGIFENVVRADKKDVLFRCDDIDGNCHQDGWAGHWRGENASDQTVICDLSFTTRQYLSQVCSQGYTVSGSKNTVYWASDLLHRIWHTDKLGHGVIGHYADTYEECLELAQTNASEAVRNSATLRYYALDVYAYDIAVPGTGCSGDDEDSDDEHDHDHESASSETATASSSESEETGGTECHTHSDGETHCV